MRDTAPQGTYKVQALDRAFAVLDLLGESDVPLGLSAGGFFTWPAQEHCAPLPDGAGTPSHGRADHEWQVSPWIAAV